MKNIINIVLFFTFITSSGQSTQNMFGEKKIKKLIDTFINLGEKDNNNISPEKSYLNIVFVPLEVNNHSTSKYAIGLNFIRYSASCNADETSQQYEYRGYIMIIIDSIKLDLSKYTFLQKSKSHKKLNLSTLPCEHLIYDPPFYSVYFDKKGIIQDLEPLGKRKLLRESLLKNKFMINLKSEQVYYTNGEGVEIDY